MTTEDGAALKSASTEERLALNRELFGKRNQLIKDKRRLEKRHEKLPTPELATELRRARLSLERVNSEIVEVNKGLVVDYVSRFFKKATSDQRDEYMAAGTAGLFEAVVSYDSTNENFATWALFAVRRNVLKALNANEHQTLSARDFGERPAVLDASAQAAQESGEGSLTASAIAKRSGVSASRVNRIQLERSTDGVDETWGKKLAAKPTVSESTGLRLDPVALDRAWKEMMREKLQDFPMQDTLVFIRHEGLDEWPPENFEVIGKWLGIGRERARRAHARVMDGLIAQGFTFPEEP